LGDRAHLAVPRVGLIHTVDAIIQSIRFGVFDYALGVNWLIVTSYMPA
jgi:hypothetical protein